jgi:hypothetical protein
MPDLTPSRPVGRLTAARLGRLVLLLLPAGLLALRDPGAVGQPPHAAAVAALLGLLAAMARPAGAALPAVALYLGALATAWQLPATGPEWRDHLAQGLLLTTPLAVFSARVLQVFGVHELRMARRAAYAIRRRAKWPTDFAELCRQPEVLDLREAARNDAAAALVLLGDHEPGTRRAALAALESRPKWRSGQADFVLRLARSETDPELRSAAVRAMGRVTSQSLLERTAEFLADPDPKVRRAAIDAVMGGEPWRWPFVRESVHEVMGSYALADDGPLVARGVPLGAPALADLTAWVAEGGAVAVRATHTLIAHYRLVLQLEPNPMLVAGLCQRVADAHVPTILRVELAHLLHEFDQLSEEVLVSLLDPAEPTSLRLLGAEALLLAGRHDRATTALREIARQPNRELAVATASIVQRCLGIDMGLGLNQPLPELHTRQAAEVARRVMLWAHQPPPPPEEAEIAEEPHSDSGVRLW